MYRIKRMSRHFMAPTTIFIGPTQQFKPWVELRKPLAKLMVIQCTCIRNYQNLPRNVNKLTTHVHNNNYNDVKTEYMYTCTCS